VVWFAGCTWKYHSIIGKANCLNYCLILKIYTQLTNVVVGLRPFVYSALGIVSIILVFKGQVYVMYGVYEYTIIDKTLTYASVTWTLTKRDRKQLNIF